MRAKAGCLLAWLLGTVAAGIAPAAGEARKAPADFKVIVALHGARKDAVAKAELVARNGRVYQFNSDAPTEVLIHDPATERVELLDMDRERMVQAEITWAELDRANDRLRRAVVQAIEKREQEGGRANRVAAAMSRDLIDPRFAATFDDRARRLRLSNPTVEAEATGEPEDDPARLGLLSSTLASAIKLDAVRNPQQIPPFPRLETLRILTRDHHLRPTETSYLFRLAGPPHRLRWTFRLVPSLTDREVEAIARIDLLRAKAARVRFDRYERPKEVEAPAGGR